MKDKKEADTSTYVFWLTIQTGEDVDGGLAKGYDESKYCALW